MLRRYVGPCLLAIFCVAGLGLTAFGQYASTTPAISDQAASQSSDNSPTLESLLPPSIAQDTDINAWAWLSLLRDSQATWPNWWATDLAVGITHRFGDSVAVTADIHYIDDDNERRGFIEQGFGTIVVSQQMQTLVTIGKFNASIGSEPRDEWDRFTGTTSLIFGAQPQDMIGAEITQPIGNTGITLRPFISTQFQGYSDLPNSPLGGLTIEYRPEHEFSAALTGLAAPGLRPAPTYQYAYLQEYMADNWEGPELYATTGGTLYFWDARLQWIPRPDWTLQAEGLLATTGQTGGDLAWSGAMLLANYDITDRWRAFAMGSYLNDVSGFVTGVAQNAFEVSGGVGFEFLPGAEVRAEYRHDFAPSGDIDSESVQLTLSY